ncbi:hornerin-like [Copidosoma floridanum]|uniref:hornerin-like n=1 Tax=Copidosoma floridanum TaxID=29053 RepID=UPI0006C97E5A|nr:hornerin-like [Copidosoma floridanum]
MARNDVLCLLACCLSVIVHLARCDAEILRNTPPQLGPAGQPGGDQIQGRFLPPFSASFSLGAGDNAHSFSVAGGPDGIGLSQSSSHGNPDYSSSQSSSLAAGLSGISASDANAVSANHPVYGPSAHANGNSFSLGQASSAAHGDVVNGQAVTGAQSSVGSTHTQAASSAQNHVQRPGRPAWTNAPPSYATGNPGYDNYYHQNSNRKPAITISVSDQPNRYGPRPSGGWYEVPGSDGNSGLPELCRDSWYRDPRCRGPRVVVNKPEYGHQRPYFETNRDPREGVQLAVGSSAQSGGFSIGQSSHLGNENRGPGSLTVNQVQTSGGGQAQAQGSSGIGSGSSSGSVVASSRPGGSSQGASMSSVLFPGPSSHSLQHSNVPPEFVRSGKKLKSHKKRDEQGPIEELLAHLSDTIHDVFDY